MVLGKLYSPEIDKKSIKLESFEEEFKMTIKRDSVGSYEVKHLGKDGYDQLLLYYEGFNPHKTNIKQVATINSMKTCLRNGQRRESTSWASDRGRLHPHRRVIKFGSSTRVSVQYSIHLSNVSSIHYLTSANSTIVNLISTYEVISDSRNIFYK